jgi:cytochrome c-type biogenesis protein CcmF
MLMIPEVGQYSLMLALSLALIQTILSMWASFTRNRVWLKVGESSAVGQLLFVGLSFSILAYCFLVNDFSVAYIAQNSNSHLPWIYRICATWGAHEGSLLLWVLVLTIWTVLFCLFSRELPWIMRGRVLSILGLISVGLLLFLLLTSNPFQRLLPDVPVDGRDLNPLLQDPGLIIHPPLLYFGYVGFSVAFAFAIAALISGKFDASWAGLARPWTLIAWSFLTLGIVLGSWWAYRVLGWGGWWFWDPVENASFLPWLSGTALIHSLLVAEKRNAFKAWSILLAVCTFSLSLMGTFLVRSGILVSVHAFAIDPARGAFILYFLAIVIGGSLLLYAWRGNKIENSGIFGFWSRETLLLTNNVLLTVAMLTVLLGTLYPLIIDALGLGKLSVGPPYFNSVFLPLMVPVLFLMAIAPAVHWQNAKPVLSVKRFKYSFSSALLLALLLLFRITHQIVLPIVIGLFLAFWVIVATLQHQVTTLRKTKAKSQIGMLLAHIGFAICTIGIVVTTTYSDQREIQMHPKDTISIGPYIVQFEQVSSFNGPNFTGYRGSFLVNYKKHTTWLLPEVRVFQTQKMAVAKTAILAKPFHDLYIALGEALDKGVWSMRIYYKPFVRWIWLGGILMMIGGLVAAARVGKKVKQAHSS